MPSEIFCPKSSCFFCIMMDPDSSLRTATLKEYIKGIHFLDDEELILVISGLWNVAMTQPNDEEFPSLGIFECMASLISKSIHDRKWLLRNQNIYIPYYAAHIIGSYTMNKVDFAVRAVDSGVVPPLMELLRGKTSWIEKRVAIRALGHLASYEKTFLAIAAYEEEVIELAVHLASSCFEEVYSMFVGVKDQRRRFQYQSDLLTRGVGGVELENQKAEEWASQMQCWSIHLLNCFAIKERSLGLICKDEFLKDLSQMWGGLVNPTSPSGVGLIRILCYSKVGRENISKSRNVVENLCKLSRSSDDWQYIGIDCLVLLLKDLDTRYNVVELATSCLVDLVELRSIGNRTNVGDAITKALLYENNIKYQYSRIKNVDVQRTLCEIWDLKIERRKREKVMSNKKIERKRAVAKLIKRRGNEKYLAGAIEEALLKYSEAMEICPLRHRNERIVLYSHRAQCNLLLRDLDSAISDTTRALSLCSPPNSHADSLWTRSQAYDMKGMAKASLMDCVLYINIVCAKSKSSADRVKIPYYAVRMISKQMETTWLFRAAQIKELNDHHTEKAERNSADKRRIAGLSTILEEPFAGKDGSARKKMEKAKERTKPL
ncbi:tetratricopeptide repeat protein 1 [Phtheirospermum japonicum]|uniref:Tetratricopeptide repeat protein 1 n=1 Tax=Phtheirospermum japonicum TaxID=374723 RepID=A0A830BZ22_9LAMI|nr:tetratricopeptide repeat protein 1 [Phtheirospermum japonicum]